MKKHFFCLFLVVCSLSVFMACSDDDNEPEPLKDGPVIEWPSNSDFKTVELETDMTGKAVIVVKAEEGIKDFKLTIASKVLTQEILGAIGLSTDMDLINDENVVDILGTFHIPVGSELKNATSVNFDVSGLVPMILALNPEESGDHIFGLNITDNKGRSIQKDLTFHNTVPSAFTVSEVDLWTNSALVSVEHLQEGAEVQYRLTGEEEWIDLTKNADGKYEIKPDWTEGMNDAGLTIYNVNSKSGFFAKKRYEFRAIVGEEVIGTGIYTTAGGDTIPNGDMSNWSEKKMGTSKVPFPNAQDNSFWDSGNNAYTTKSPLCSQGTDNDAGTAVLKATKVLGAVFAAGNMFTGTFTQSGFTGNANFGVNYTFTARPVALKLRYKVKVDICNNGGTYDPQKDEYLNQKIDEARIFVAITDWTSSHTVTSGLADPTPTIWDPATQKSTAEGDILAYASVNLGENAEDWKELIIPINWYSPAAAMPSKDYSLVISCATSARGDYLTGSTNNELHVDDFEWVY